MMDESSSPCVSSVAVGNGACPTTPTKEAALPPPLPRPRLPRPRVRRQQVPVAEEADLHDQLPALDAARVVEDRREAELAARVHAGEVPRDRLASGDVAHAHVARPTALRARHSLWTHDRAADLVAERSGAV